MSEGIGDDKVLINDRNIYRIGGCAMVIAGLNETTEV